VTFTRADLKDAVLLINKNRGLTSFDIIGVLRKLLGIRKIGHAGTLDKAAEGLLVVCVGRATRLSSILMDKRKKYTGAVRLGVTTDSYDTEGEVIDTRPVDHLTREMILNTVDSFKGSIMQRPPDYSAIKIAGKRSSDLVRKGQSVDIVSRPVEIYSIETELIDMHGMTVTIGVECSKGTYIRSLARDMGEQLGCGAHLSSLTRTGSGIFSLADAVTLTELESALAAGSSEKRFFYSPLEALSDLDVVTVSESGALKVFHGAQIDRSDCIALSNETAGLFAVADESKNLIAIADIIVDNWSVKYRCVFH
jgi:tRNA pseudouridine55 synthase